MTTRTVPREPTQEMIAFGVTVLSVTGGNTWDDVRAMWRAMFDAAPTPQQRGEQPIAWMYAADGEGSYIVFDRNRQAPDPGSRWTETPLYACLPCHRAAPTPQPVDDIDKAMSLMPPRPVDDLVERLGFAYNKLSEDILEEAAARIVADAERIAELWQYRHGHMPDCAGMDFAQNRCGCGYLDGTAYRDLLDRAERAEAQVAALTAERDAMYRFARMHGHMAIDIQNAIDAARKGTP